MLGEKQYTPSSRNAAGSSPATIPPVSGVMPIQERKPIGERNVLAEHHAMHLVVGADDLALVPTRTVALYTSGVLRLLPEPAIGIVDPIDADHHRRAEAVSQVQPSRVGPYDAISSGVRVDFGRHLVTLDRT